ncbi:MAG: family transposase [Bacteroidetes bacterium]|nr:family transposase [Bacteroidota bacterium]
MADTYSQIYIQVVFAVKFRQNLVTENNRIELQKVMSGLIASRGVKLYAIYCMPDHTHIFVSMNPSQSISDLIRDLKSASSKFINDKKWINGTFQWQNGFGAFSYSHSHIDAVVKYILNQEEHHRKRTFREECKLPLFSDHLKVEFR